MQNEDKNKKITIDKPLGEIVLDMTFGSEQTIEQQRLDEMVQRKRGRKANKAK